MSFIEFELIDNKRFEMLAAIFEALRTAKQSGDFRDNAYWLSFFDNTALSHFWNPTKDELLEWERQWKATPFQDRLSDPNLKRLWEFGSMIDAFRDGEYELIACRHVSANIGQLEFAPFALPYGGTECIKALIEAFEFRVTKEVE
jgi:hypothetical protein